MNIIDVAEKILSTYSLCDNCLGRLFGALGTGTSNAQRGYSIKLLLTMNLHEKILTTKSNIDHLRQKLKNIAETGFTPAETLLEKLFGQSVSKKKCDLCSNLFTTFSKYIKKAEEKILQKHIEFKSFQVASKIFPNVLVKEEEIKSQFNLQWAESIKKEINRELGKLLQKKINKAVEIGNADILVEVDFVNEKIDLKIRPLFLYCFYRKLIRGIPQSIWRKHEKYSGKKIYPFSLEELIIRKILPIFKGTIATLHAAGREDIDARMLGNGRPCIIEIKNPLIRYIDLKTVEKAINKPLSDLVSLKLIDFVDKQFLIDLKGKGESTRKIYYTIVQLDQVVSKEQLHELELFFTNRTISQRTPTRVIHRRKDKIRYKKVYKLSVKKHKKNILALEIIAQGGLYIKELISGDAGRTTPCIAEILKTNAKCLLLDVLDIIMEDDIHGQKEQRI